MLSMRVVVENRLVRLDEYVAISAIARTEFDQW